jgi:hypothetical protein
MPEPDVAFPGDDNDLHYAAEGPNFCADTFSWLCVNTSNYCG